MVPSESVDELSETSDQPLLAPDPILLFGRDFKGGRLFGKRSSCHP